MRSAFPRILLVVPSASSFRVFLRELAERWVAEGGELAVATSSDLPGVVDDRWPQGVVRFALPDFRKGGVLGLWRAACTLGRIVREWRPQLVHAHFGVAVLVCALARRRSDGARWLASFHGLHATAERRTAAGLAGRVETWSARRMDRVCVLNREDQEYLAARMPAGRVRLQPGFGVGCLLDRFQAERFDAATRAKLRRDLEIVDRAPVLIFVGRQVAFKGFAAVVRAWDLARRELPGLRLLLVGTLDPLHPNGLGDAEQALLTDPAVLNLGWRTDVEALLAISDLCLFPSRREGMPVNLMEALAMGVPVITSDTRGCRDVVRDGVDGIVLATEDPAEWAQACVALLRDDTRRAAYQAAAIAGRGRFDRRLFIEEQLELWRGFACRETSGRE
jgi:glycosyltransferase involved in cell wall biosynthesis